MDDNISSQPEKIPPYSAVPSSVFTVVSACLGKYAWCYFKEGMVWMWVKRPNIRPINQTGAQDQKQYCTDDWGVFHGIIF